jgi:DNA primase
VSEEAAPLHERKRWVLANVPIGAVVAGEVVLSGSPGSEQRRGACPFHSSASGKKSTSFSVKSPRNHADGFAHCFGCAWHGNVIDFVMALRGWSFLDALEELERQEGSPFARQAGTSKPASAPLRREPVASAKVQRERPLIDPLEMGRAIWHRARTDHGAVRRYFAGRGVPLAVLTDARLRDFRFLGDAPVHLWEIRDAADLRRWPKSVLTAPAVVAMVRRVQMLDAVGGPVLDFVPCGVHVTYLDPDGTSTMLRVKPWAKPDDEDRHFPKRRMLGPVGHGAVLLGEYSPAADLWVGEGNETVLSGMALGAAGSGDVGVVALSLDNLQGQPLKWHGNIWPLHALRPDPERPAFLIPGHRGAVTGLVDSDMSPLKNQKVIEHKRAPIVTRALTGAERAQICGELFVKAWRGVGASPVQALRAPNGMDFNDAVRAQLGDEVAA